MHNDHRIPYSTYGFRGGHRHLFYLEGALEAFLLDIVSHND